ncbi:unnamed protein product, partial [marine sediment metagenome]
MYVWAHALAHGLARADVTPGVGAKGGHLGVELEGPIPLLHAGL